MLRNGLRLERTMAVYCVSTPASTSVCKWKLAWRYSFGRSLGMQRLGSQQGTGTKAPRPEPNRGRGSPDYTPQDASGSAPHWRKRRRWRRATGRPAYTPSLGEDVPSSGGAMRPDQASLWYRRMSSVYALGTWTLLGSLILSGRKKSKPLADEVEQKDVSTYESSESGDELDLTKEITEPPKGFYVETIVTYKEDFVPMTDKILNYWKSWTGGPGPES